MYSKLTYTKQEVGSWEVRVSLAAVGQWIRSLGQLEPAIAFGQGLPLPPATAPPCPEISNLFSEYRQTGEFLAGADHRKILSAIKHAAVLEKTPVTEGKAPIVLNANSPTWL